MKQPSLSLILFIIAIVVAFNVAIKLTEDKYKKDFAIIQSQFDSLKNMTWKSVGQTKMALDSLEKYKKLYLKSKATLQP